MPLNEACASGESAPLLDSTIGDHFDAIVARYPEHTALVMPHQEIHWTYREFHQRVNALASGLLSLGIGPGDRVGIWSPNRVEWVLTQFATARIGAVMVCINPAYRLTELEYALNKVACKALVTAERFKDSHYLQMIQSLAPELASATPGQLDCARLPTLRAVIRMGEAVTPGMLNFNALCSETAVDDSALRQIARTLEPDDVVNIQFTSGTTGHPKGAALTHRNILNNAWFCGMSMNLTDRDRLCIPVPLYHCFGMVMGTLCCVARGATMVLPAEVFDPAATLQAVQDHRCTALHGVPTMFFAELDLPHLESFELGSLRTGLIAGSTCPAALMERLIGDMGLTEIVIAYGQTECSPVNHATRIADSFQQRTTTVGRPHFNWTVKIQRDDGSVAAIGETGEICARGYGVMDRYWDEPERTAETIDSDGFLHSGDLGEMDADGYVKVTGRIKDMIIRGGENIYPREVEEYLYQHPAIAEAQVFGVPDERYGEQVAAWIRLREGAELDAEGLRAFCAGNITHFKVPKYIKFVEDYPMTVTGKMQKFRMREDYASELGLIR